MRFYNRPALGVLFFACVGLAACDNDVPINAPYEKDAVVYGLLDKGDSIHYVKVNKSFISKGNDARQVARNRDSLLFGEQIRVRLQEIQEGEVQENHTLFRDTLQNREPGLFPDPEHVLYRTPPVNLKVNARYKLVIDQLKEGESVTAQTAIVGDVNYIFPPPQLPGSRSATFPVGFNDELEFEYKPDSRSHFYTLLVATIVTTVDTTTGQTMQDTARWPIYRQRQVDRDLEVQRETQAFFENLGQQLNSDPDLVRPLDSVETRVIVAGGTEDLYTYLQVSQPSLGIVQKRPEFTNLSSGRGIFASRRRQRFTYTFSDEAKDSLQQNRFTRDLGFVRDF